MKDDLSILGEFGGVVRLFPLPNLVLFPHVVQPLHIFEPRYRHMTKDALAGDRLIAMVLLKPGWEKEYEGSPAIHEIGCLGQIASEQLLPDGKYNLLLRGLCRLRLGAELDHKKSYRTARAELLADPAHEDVPAIRKLLIDQCQEWFPKQMPVTAQLNAILKMKQPLGTLCDILAFALPLAPEMKQELLTALGVEERARRLIHELKKTPPPKAFAASKMSGYPPAFSAN